MLYWQVFRDMKKLELLNTAGQNVKKIQLLLNIV